MPFLRRRRKIVIVVISREDVVRFVLYDFAFSWIAYKALSRLHAPGLLPFLGSAAGPMLLRKLMEGRY